MTKTPKLNVKKSGGKYGEDRTPTFSSVAVTEDTLRSIDKHLVELIDLFRVAFIDDRMVK